jgi:hypothetical protein
VTLSRRVLLGTVAAATVLPASRSRAQQEPIRIGVLNDQSGLYRDFGGPTSVLAARRRQSSDLAIGNLPIFDRQSFGVLGARTGSNVSV